MAGVALRCPLALIRATAQGSWDGWTWMSFLLMLSTSLRDHTKEAGASFVYQKLSLHHFENKEKY